MFQASFQSRRLSVSSSIRLAICSSMVGPLSHDRTALIATPYSVSVAAAKTNETKRPEPNEEGRKAGSGTACLCPGFLAASFRVLRPVRTKDPNCRVLSDHFEERAAILDKVLADGTGPQDAHEKGGRQSLARYVDLDLHLLAQQPPGADQANPVGRQITRQQREGAVVIGCYLNRLHEVDAVFFTAFTGPGSI